MITRRVATALLGVSIIGGVAAGVAADALTSDQQAPAAVARPTSAPKPDMEVDDPELVLNDDGTAMLSATLVNHHQYALDLNGATGGRKDDLNAPYLIVWGNRLSVPIEPGQSMRIGGVGDAWRIRFSERVQVGSTLPVTLQFLRHGGSGDLVQVTLVAPVVERDAQHADVANNGPNPDIAVEDGVVVVVPGQAKAYIGGRIVSTVEDIAFGRPTVVSAGRDGGDVDFLHQTATGGPSDVIASPDRRSELGSPPYLESALEGSDADYVRASDVTVGETIKVTFRFASGDVVGRFKVVQGRADGTI